MARTVGSRAGHGQQLRRAGCNRAASQKSAEQATTADQQVQTRAPDLKPRQSVSPSVSQGSTAPRGDVELVVLDVLLEHLRSAPRVVGPG